MHYYNKGYYVGDKYQEYLQTPHWIKLQEKYIFSNKKARCWICETPVYVFSKEGRKASNLLIHHVSYANLFNEKYYRDIYILCYRCHTQVHFYKIFIFFPITTRLKKRDLLQRMLFFRLKYCMQKKRITLSVWYFLRYLIGL